MKKTLNPNQTNTQNKIKVKTSILIRVGIDMVACSDEDKEIFLKTFNENFAKDQIRIIKNDVDLDEVNGVVKNLLVFEIESFDLKNYDMKRKLIITLIENFIEHYMNDNTNSYTLDTFFKINVDPTDLKDESCRHGIMLFCDFISKKTFTDAQFDKAFVNEWKNIIFLNREKEQNESQIALYKKRFELSSKHTIIRYIDEGPIDILLKFANNFNYIEYKSYGSNTIRDRKVMLLEYAKGFKRYMKNEEGIKILDENYTYNFQTISPFSMKFFMKNIATAWLKKRFVENNNRIFNNELDILDRFLTKENITEEEINQEEQKRMNQNYNKPFAKKLK